MASKHQARMTEYFSKTKRRAGAKSPVAKKLKMDAPPSDETIDDGKAQTRSSTSTRNKNQLQTTPIVSQPTTNETKFVSPVLKRKSHITDGEEAPGSVGSNKGSARRQLQFAKRKLTQNGDPPPKLELSPPKQKPPEEPKEPEITMPEMFAKKKQVIRKGLKAPARNIAQLRADMAEFSAAAARLNDQRKETAAQEREQIKTALSPKKTPQKEAHKTPEKPIAAERFEALAKIEVPALELPKNDDLLLEIFKGVDFSSSRYLSRDELNTFEKLKPAVQQMTRRNFDHKHLGQIKHLYPESYNLRIEKRRSRFGERARPDEFDLVITPNLENDLLQAKLLTPSKPTPKAEPQNLRFSPIKLPPSASKSHPFRSPKKTPKKREEGTPPPEEIDSRPKLTGTRMKLRQQTFKNRIIQRLKMLHKKFLSTLDPPVCLSEADNSCLQRWHPAFLSSSIPPVPVAELPKPPTINKIRTARDIFGDSEEKKEEVKPIENVEVPEISAKLKAKLAGVPQNVVDKILAKQALKQRMDMLRNPEEEKLKARVERLPDLARIIRTYFLSEKKSSIPEANVIRILTNSYGSLLSKGWFV